MAIVPVCLMITAAAALSVHPDKSAFFYYETVTLSCAVLDNLRTDWTVKRNTSTKSFLSCEVWGQLRGSSCSIKGAYPSDSGVYWCESASGESSNAINITVSTGLILESPAAPLTPGANVTLKCSYKEKYAKESTSNFSTAFFRNGKFIGNKPEGQMILKNVSKEDEGFYKCKHPTQGESPQSWVAVSGDDDDDDDNEERAAPVPTDTLIPLPKLVSTALLFIFYTGVLILSVYKCRKLAQARAEAKRKAPCHL